MGQLDLKKALTQSSVFETTFNPSTQHMVGKKPLFFLMTRL